MDDLTNLVSGVNDVFVFVELTILCNGQTTFHRIPTFSVSSHISKLFSETAGMDYIMFEGIKIDTNMATSIICRPLEGSYWIFYMHEPLFPLRLKMHIEAFTVVLQPTDITIFKEKPFLDPHHNIEKLKNTIVKHMFDFSRSDYLYKAPFINFFQSTGTGKTTTVIKLGEHFKVIYISLKASSINIQPTRSVHILNQLHKFINEPQYKIETILRLFMLSCLQVTKSVEGNFVWASEGECSAIMNSFADNISKSNLDTLSGDSVLNEIIKLRSLKPALIVFDLPNSPTPSDTKLVNFFENALRYNHSIFGIFVNTMSQPPPVSVPIEITPTHRPRGIHGTKLFPVFISTPYADVLAEEKEKMIHILALSIATVRNEKAEEAIDFKRDLSVLLTQGRIIWGSEYSSDSRLNCYHKFIKFVFSKFINDFRYPDLFKLNDSTLLSLANNKFNLKISPSHKLAYQMVKENLATCFGVSEDRKEIYTILLSEPSIIEAINFNLLFSDQEKGVDDRKIDSSKYFKNVSFLLEKILSFKSEAALSPEDSAEYIVRVLFIMAADMNCIINGRIHSSIPSDTESFLNQLLGTTFLESLRLPLEYLSGFISCSHFTRMYSSRCALTPQLAKDAFKRNTALIFQTDINFVGSVLEIPVAYCRSYQELLIWKKFLLVRNCENVSIQKRAEIDALIDDLTIFTFISVAVNDEVVEGFSSVSDKTGVFDSLNPFLVDENGGGESLLRNKFFQVENGLNLQIYFSLQSPKNSITEFKRYRSNRSETVPGSYSCKRICIEGLSPETFGHWNGNGFDEGHRDQCFNLLKSFDYDLDYNIFMQSIEQNPSLVPLAFDS